MEEKIAMRVSWHTLIANAALSAFKLFAGLSAHSAAMVSDAVHTLSDVFSTIIVMIGVRMAGRQSDKEHPYGHERMECVAAVVLAALLFATGLSIGWGGIRKMVDGQYEQPVIPGILALVAAIVSIAVKEGMYWYTRGAAQKIGSGALLADAWHHRSDAMSSLGSLAGILGARIGFPIMDAAVCVVISALIIKTAVAIFQDAVGKMTDKACDDTIIEEISAVVRDQNDVLGIDSLQTRLFGDKFYVDLEISANGDFTLNEAHGVAQRVHDAIEKRFPKVKHCMVHVNPTRADKCEPMQNSDKY